MADKTAAKIAFDSLHVIRRQQNNILTRGVYRESGFAGTESETEFWDAFKKSLSAKVLAADVFWSHATSPSTMKNRKIVKGGKRKTEKGGKRETEKGERERGREGERKREMAGGLVQRNRSSERFCLPTRTFNEKDRFSESVIRIACFCPIPMSWRALENFARASVETGSTTKCREKGMLKVVRDGKQSNFSKSSGCALVQYGF